MVPFKELGLGLSEEQISEEEAHNLTDGFSLPALKVIHLWKGRAEKKVGSLGLCFCFLKMNGVHYLLWFPEYRHHNSLISLNIVIKAIVDLKLPL